jgi:hypothetical protein
LSGSGLWQMRRDPSANLKERTGATRQAPPASRRHMHSGPQSGPARCKQFGPTAGRDRAERRGGRAQKGRRAKARRLRTSCARARPRHKSTPRMTVTRAAPARGRRARTPARNCAAPRARAAFARRPDTALATARARHPFCRAAFPTLAQQAPAQRTRPQPAGGPDQVHRDGPRTAQTRAPAPHLPPSPPALSPSPPYH